jgi:hypothetical protein
MEAWFALEQRHRVVLMRGKRGASPPPTSPLYTAQTGVQERVYSPTWSHDRSQNMAPCKKQQGLAGQQRTHTCAEVHLDGGGGGEEGGLPPLAFVHSTNRGAGESV